MTNPLLLYSTLSSWYHLVDPVADHLDEAEAYEAAFERTISGEAGTLLELGCGAANNAFYLKRRFRCTLTDVSSEMLSLSQRQNPECEHIQGDMRSLRLGRLFDAVLVHDAVVYLTTEDEVLEAATTAFVHTRPGGAAIFAPDATRERFRESTNLIEGDDGSRALRCVEWMWDPDPADTTYSVEYGFLLREDGVVRAVHDSHVEGLFSESTWHRLLGTAGFDMETVERPIGNGETDRIFLCRRRP